jgi:hypothetical protein
LCDVTKLCGVIKFANVRPQKKTQHINVLCIYGPPVIIRSLHYFS